LANTTVSQSQTVMIQANADGSAIDHDEHDRVAPQRGRVELAQRVRQ
jgi:hypothetical protein